MSKDMHPDTLLAECCGFESVRDTPYNGSPSAEAGLS